MIRPCLWATPAECIRTACLAFHWPSRPDLPVDALSSVHTRCDLAADGSNLTWGVCGIFVMLTFYSIASSTLDGHHNLWCLWFAFWGTTFALYICLYYLSVNLRFYRSTSW